MAAWLMIAGLIGFMTWFSIIASIGLVRIVRVLCEKKEV